jgi:hypothetical protein
MLHSCCCIYFLLCSGFILFCVGLKDFIWNSLLNKQIKKKGRRSLPGVGGLESHLTGPFCFFFPRGGPNQPAALPRTRVGGPARQHCRGPSQTSPQQPLPFLWSLTDGPHLSVASSPTRRVRAGHEHRFQPPKSRILRFLTEYEYVRL